MWALTRRPVVRRMKSPFPFLGYSMHGPSHLPVPSERERFHVVLVEPGDSLNVGSVARAMMNLGFDRLHLVSPKRYDPHRAAISACWATKLLDAARIHDSLEAALAPMERVVGFTARTGSGRARHLLLPDWCAQLAEAQPAETALLFGPEDHGLTREHLTHCRWLVRIPSTEAYPSFNLSQSVLLALFELRRSDWGAMPREPKPMPPIGDFAQLDRLVDSVLIQGGYFHEGTPRPVPQIVKHLLRRIDPDEREMGILMGMFGKINRVLLGKAPRRPLPERSEPEETEGHDGRDA